MRWWRRLRTLSGTIPAGTVSRCPRRGRSWMRSRPCSISGRISWRDLLGRLARSLLQFLVNCQYLLPPNPQIHLHLPANAPREPVPAVQVCNQRLHGGLRDVLLSQADSDRAGRGQGCVRLHRRVQGEAVCCRLHCRRGAGGEQCADSDQQLDPGNF